MRELTVRIKFTAPCLGNAKVARIRRVAGKKRKNTVFLLPRDQERRVVFQHNWWAIILGKAAEIACRHQRDVRQVRFDRVVDGNPTFTGNNLYKRYYVKDRFSLHEAFAEGDVVGLSCVVPEKITDDSFWQLMTNAGRFYGISPAKHGEFGFFEVVSIQKGLAAKSETESEVPETTV